jgi:hypothetical protein
MKICKNFEQAKASAREVPEEFNNRVYVISGVNMDDDSYHYYANGYDVYLDGEHVDRYDSKSCAMEIAQILVDDPSLVSALQVHNS